MGCGGGTSRREDWTEAGCVLMLSEKRGCVGAQYGSQERTGSAEGAPPLLPELQLREGGRVRLVQGKQKVEVGLGGSGRSGYLYSSRGGSWSGSS